MQMYEVGGCVRDEILGVPSKDIDFTVVLGDEDMRSVFWQDDPFLVMHDKLVDMGFRVFKTDPEYLTIRAQFPVGKGGLDSIGIDGKPIRGRAVTADFVLARKEGDYTDGRRPDAVVPGTLMDDLKRRDFTMNAIAKGPDGSLIDPFDGIKDISAKVIRAVGDPFERLTEDALRAVRAMRFAVTKGFKIDPQLRFAMESEAVVHLIKTKISDERKREELEKMFRFDTLKSLSVLHEFPHLTEAVFAGSVSLDATMKQKGRGR